MKYFIQAYIIALAGLLAANAFPGRLAADISAIKNNQELHKPDSERKTEVRGYGSGVTLKRALNLALSKNPDLSASAMEIKVAEARKLQAGLWPNPEFSIETENFGGKGELQGAEGMETTAQLSQLIELGGKRSGRLKTADISSRLASLNYEIERLDVVERTSIAFIELLAAQERAALGEEMLILADRTHNTVIALAKAGKASPVESVKSRISLSGSRMELKKLIKNSEIARRVLSSNWGAKTPLFEKALGRLDVIFPVPDKLSPDAISGNQELLRWSLKIEKRKAEIEYEKSEAIPDITLSGGVRRFNETGDNAFVFGVFAPLKIFNRNQGRIIESEHKLELIRRKKRAAEVKIQARIDKSHQTLSLSFSEAEMWKRQILPDAQAALKAVENGYRQGKFTLLELMDAQRTFFQAKSVYIETLTEYHKSLSNLERLTNMSINKTRKTGSLEKNHEK